MCLKNHKPNLVLVLLSNFVEFLTTVPPEWVTKPQDEEVVEGQDIVFPCKVTGVPQPTVVWRKLAGKLFYLIWISKKVY